MREAYIVDAIRTPIGKYGGGLSGIRADDLAALPIREIFGRNPQLPLDAVEDVILGCANQAGEDNRNVARMAALLAGLPETVPGETVNRLCASGLSAAVNCARTIAVGEGEVFVAGGIEHMSRAPYVMSKSERGCDRGQTMHDTTMGWRFAHPRFVRHWGVESMGQTAENLVEQYSISREDQDQFALWSQQKTAAAVASGRLAREILTISVLQKKGGALTVDADEFPRPDTSANALAALKPAFKEDGSVTAGNSSGLNDGACALLLASRDAMTKYGMKPKAQILGSAVVGVPPRIMGIGPVEATKKVLARLSLSLEQMDVIEINEAFSAQSLACIRELGLKDDDPRINPNGGAISLGHPLGMTGARLLSTAVRELRTEGKRYALITMCVGVGQGMATVIERVET